VISFGTWICIFSHNETCFVSRNFAILHPEFQSPDGKVFIPLSHCPCAGLLDNQRCSIRKDVDHASLASIMVRDRQCMDMRALRRVHHDVEEKLLNSMTCQTCRFEGDVQMRRMII